MTDILTLTDLGDWDGLELGLGLWLGLGLDRSGVIGDDIGGETGLEGMLGLRLRFWLRFWPNKGTGLGRFRPGGVEKIGVGEVMGPGRV